MKKRIAPKARKENLVVQELDGEVLIYDLNTNKAFSLNETSSLVWQLCDGDNSVSEISESISRKLNSPANEDLVWLALDQLKKEKLIANGDEVVSNFTGMSRREVIKKVGLGTMIALPIVSSLVAPTAASAQSATCGGNCGASLACAPVMNCLCSNPGEPQNMGTCTLVTTPAGGRS
jgi:hypothetical protein